MKRRKFIKTGHKNDMWFIVEEVTYIPISLTQSEKSVTHILRVFYSYNKAEESLNKIAV